MRRRPVDPIVGDLLEVTGLSAAGLALFAIGAFFLGEDQRAPLVAGSALLVLTFGSLPGRRDRASRTSTRGLGSLVMLGAVPSFLLATFAALMARVHREPVTARAGAAAIAVLEGISFAGCALVCVVVWRALAGLPRATLARHSGAVLIAVLCGAVALTAPATSRALRHPSPGAFAAAIVKRCPDAGLGECVFEGPEAVRFHRGPPCCGVLDWNMATFRSIRSHIAPPVEWVVVAWGGLLVALVSAGRRARARRSSRNKLAWTEVWGEGRCRLVEPRVLEAPGYRGSPEQLDSRFTVPGTRAELAQRIAGDDAVAWIHATAIAAVTTAPVFAAAALGFVFER